MPALFLKRLLRLVLPLLLLFTAPTVQALSYTLEISEAELQEKIAAMMPLQKKKFFVTVIFSNPKIELAETENQFGIYAQIDIQAPGGINSSGHTRISGTLSYAAEKSEFYFQNPRLLELDFDKLPPLYQPLVQDIVQLMMRKMLSTYPVYRLQGGDLPRNLAKALLKSVTVAHKQLIVELELF